MHVIGEYPGKTASAETYFKQTGEDLFSYSRMRAVPVRQIVPKEHYAFIRKSFFSDEDGLDIRDKYHDDLHVNEVWDEVTRVKNQYDFLKPKVAQIDDEKRSENYNWHPDEMIKLAYDCGAKLAGAMSYYDPYYKREMCAITIAVEMEQEYVKQTPSVPTLQHVFVKYKESTDVVTKISEAMTSKGIFCQPVVSLSFFDPNCNEFNLPRMAVESGLGIMGKHNLLLTADYGPRVRLAAVYLYKSKYWDTLDQAVDPVIQEMQERCDSCTACLKMCPPDALAMDDVRKCSQYFLEHENCGICMMVCPLGKVSAKKSLEKSRTKQKVHRKRA